MVNKTFHIKKIIFALVMVLVFGMMVYGNDRQINRIKDRLIGTWERETTGLISSIFTADKIVFYREGEGTMNDRFDFQWVLIDTETLRIRSDRAGTQTYSIELYWPGAVSRLFSGDKPTLILNNRNPLYPPTTYIKK